MESNESVLTVTLNSLGGGAAHELFQRELERVIENILDPNTDESTAREVSLKVKIKPEKGERTISGVKITCVSKLAALNTVSSRFYLGRRHGKLVALEHNPQQLTFDDALKQNGAPKNLVGFAGGAGAGEQSRE